MKTVSVRLVDLNRVTLQIGFVGENLHRRVQIDSKKAFDEYPNAVPSLTVKPPAGDIYSPAVTRIGDIVIWDIEATDVASEGDGEIQLDFVQGNTLMKSYTGKTKIGHSIVPGGGGGGGGTTNYNALSNKPQIGGKELVGDQTPAELGLATPSDIPDVSGFYTKPASGIPASDIAEGVIPDVSGKLEAPATPGTQGQVLTSDGNGGQSWEDQTGGDPTEIIDDTAGEGDTDKTWSADKLDTELTDVKNAIEGISDLFTEEASDNLFDKSSKTSDKYFNVKWDGSYSGIANDSSMNYEYVPVDGDGTYSAKVATNHLGTNAKYIPLFNESHENVTVVTGTVSDSICVFEITAEHIANGVKYIGYSVSDNDIDTAMLVKSGTYPSEYIPYFHMEMFNGGTRAENITGLADAVEPLIAPIEKSLLADEETLEAISVNFYEDIGENLFNKTDVTDNKYFNINGSGVYKGISNDSEVCIAYIPIREAGTYTAKVAYSFFGAIAKFIPLFDRIKENVSVVTGTFDSQDSSICTFTIQNTDISNGAVYIGLSVKKTDKDTAMLVKGSAYPSEYKPYVNNGMVFTGDTERENVRDLLVKHNKSANLFNNNDVTYGKYFSINGSGVYSGLADSGNAFISYVPIDGAGNYTMKNAKQIYGTYIVKFVALFNSSKEYLSVVTGSVDSSDNSITHFEITQTDINNGAYYIGYTIYTTQLGIAMLVKASAYPAEYIPYYNEYVELKEDIKLKTGINPLFGKTVVFDGDSICQDGQCGGWAKMIGNGNGMVWKNAGIAGGTITAGTYSGGTALHWVCRSIDDIHSEFDNLDYLIFEGGTNDADRLTDGQIGTVDPANFSTFDDETFVGALESLFYKATSYYPTAKIGFIIAHRMGYASGARYDAADSPSTRRRRKFFETAIEVCQKWGIPYIDLWESSPLCPMLECYYDSTMTGAENTEAGKAYTDGQHLTPVGYSIITPKIEAWMKTL